MDSLNNIAPAPDLEPPKESRSSIVLNSVGNGMMLGAVPFIALEANALRTGKPLGKLSQGLSLAASAVGGLLGWVFGEKEANRLENYRNNIAQEITTLRNDVHELKQERRHWQTHLRDETTHEKSEGVSL